jgi:hypothetical protein
MDLEDELLIIKRIDNVLYMLYVHYSEDKKQAVEESRRERCGKTSL